MAFFTYMVASKRNGTLYIGHTDDLIRRVSEHREHIIPGFTHRYNVTRLVWFEIHATREGAFKRERRFKEWPRTWKLDLIEAENPGWDDLFNSLL